MELIGTYNSRKQAGRPSASSVSKKPSLSHFLCMVQKKHTDVTTVRIHERKGEKQSGIVENAICFYVTREKRMTTASTCTIKICKIHAHQQ